jgi:DNA-binding beta-propeller fold protein YncE
MSALNRRAAGSLHRALSGLFCAILVAGCSEDSGAAGNGAAGSADSANGGAGAGAQGGSANGGAGAGAQGGSANGAVDAALDSDGVPRLFYLDLLGGRVFSAAPDVSDVRVLVSSLTTAPDGIAVDPIAGQVYWTNMGAAEVNDGSLQRVAVDGSNITTIVPPGGTFTPKQLKLDGASGKLYWSDREGMRVMRSNADGSQIETLITVAEGDTARLDASNWCVGIAVDPDGGHVYWTQKGPDDGYMGTIKRAELEIPAGQDSRTRSDIEVLFQALPEPIDLDLDLERRQIYWTDRGDNTVNRAAMDMPSGASAATRADREILVTGLGEAIGVALDLEAGVMYFTGLDGRLGRANLDGSAPATLLEGQGMLTGIVYVEVPD